MKTRVALIIIAIFLALTYPIQQYIDKHHPVEEAVEQVLFLPAGNIVKRLSFGFDGIMADFYWMRSVQYFGRQMLDENQEFDWSRVGKVRYDLLYPLLDITTTLDPNYIEAYRFGALFLPDYNYNQALKLLLKGIDNNPANWRLYMNLGTLYWHQKDYQHASEAFFKGGEQPRAPSWMKVLGGVMLTQGGSRATACQLYTEFYEEAKNSNDELTRSQMEAQIKRIYALDQVDYLNELLDHYRQATDNCPTSLTQLAPTIKQGPKVKGVCGEVIQIELNEKGEPISPLGDYYRYDPKECKIKMSFELYEP